MKRTIPVLIFLFLAGCTPSDRNNVPSEPARAFHTLAEDITFLEQHGAVEQLVAPNGARVVLSARYQGRVMTSSVAPDSMSFGWINRDFITAGQTGGQFDNYGGEDRFWLGPEGGQFGLYFPPGQPFEFSHWQVPAALNQGVWNVKARSDTSVTYGVAMDIRNYSGSRFVMDLDRTIRLLTAGDLNGFLGQALPQDVRWVGYETINTVTNTGDSTWTAEGGKPSIWILGMFEPLDTTYVVVPYRGTTTDGAVNDAYFGKVPADRLSVRDGYVLFKCDGTYRSKIGIGPDHVLPVAGSYNKTHRVLTLVQFTVPEPPGPYVNSMWETQQEPYKGDVLNSYNDGPTEPGKPALGGFYEIESSSPALGLSPHQTYTHVHRTVHLTGSEAALDGIARNVLGVPLQTIAAGI